jgi:hypothetical protein
MLFRGGNYNRITRLFAGLVVLAMGAPLLLFRNPVILLLGAAICGIGFGAVVWQGVQMWREREDPYDLNKLWDTPPPEPDTPTKTSADATLIYCHRCGSSMSEVHAICPQCGNFLGT